MSTEEPVPKQKKISTTATTVLAFVVLICLMLPTTIYNRQVKAYLNDPTALLYYNTQVITNATAPELALTVDSLDNEIYGKYLTLRNPSTDLLREWLNTSLAQGPGIVQFNHSARHETSTVIYKACCGLGHRLTRLEDAAHVAALFEATLDVRWSDCGADTFQSLFGTDPLQVSRQLSTGYSCTFANDVPRCYGIDTVHGSPDLCHVILEGKVQAAARLYQELLHRYVRRNVVQEFIKTHFEGRTSIGIHIRAGNNETGDFTRKNRQISDMNAFVKLNAGRIRSMGLSPAVLFVATDTPSYVDAFRSELNDTMPVVELEQVRAEEGSGVLFGEHGAPKPKGEVCLEGWHAALQDMMILASTDVVFASTYSSFTRTMPRILALTRPDRPVNASFCENWINPPEMVCYSSIEEFQANPPS